MRFTKMQGAGNDYVYVDLWQERVDDPAELARRVSDRHFGIGSDGLILIGPDEQADVRMRMFNSDGSESQMCGNGVRCVAKYAYDHGRSRANPMRVATRGGIKTIELHVGSDGKVASATVDMGEPILAGRAIPTTFEGDKVVDAPLECDGRRYKVTCVSMGNPHAVIYVDDLAKVDLAAVGAGLEHHCAFPERVNVHFVQAHSAGEVSMATWERGSGITLACGTGASAVCVAGVLTRRSARSILAHLPGGDLMLQWRQDDNRVRMTGPAVEVFSGEWPL